MQLKWGTYEFDADSVEIATESELLRNDAGIPYGFQTTMVCTGWLKADGQAAITTAMLALQTALRRPYQDLILFQDSGSRSATLLTNSDSISGVVITRGPSFPDSKGPEYTTLRRFSFTAQAEYPLSGTGLILISFRERMTYAGGGPLYIMKRALNGKPQRQLVYPYTEFIVQQTGEAVGYKQYPVAPPPKFPAFLKQAPSFSKTGPKRMGRTKQRDFGITWEYVFESADPLVAVPTLWLGN